MAKLILADITTSGTGFDVAINANNTLLEAALENTLSRDGSSPNAMGADLDMNSNDINNLPDATAQQSPVTLAQLNAATLAAISVLGDIADVDQTGVADNDLLFRSGGEWIDTAGLLTWDGSHLVLPQTNDAVTPTLAFGDGNTGLYESSDNVLCVAINGAARFNWASSTYQGTNGVAMLNEAASSTNPVFVPQVSDPDTGIGWTSADQLSIISGGEESARTTTAALGGLFVNNDLTGTGLERILTTSDIAAAAFPLVGLDNEELRLGTGTDFTMDYDGSNLLAQIATAGDFLFTGADNGIAVDGNFLMEGYSTGKSVLRSIRFIVSPGSVPNTNLTVNNNNTNRSYNAPSISNATNMVAAGSSGSWALSADGLGLSLDLTEDVVGLIGVDRLIAVINSASQTETYYVETQIIGSNIQFLCFRRGSNAAISWLTIMDASDQFQIVCQFVTSS